MSAATPNGFVNGIKILRGDDQSPIGYNLICSAFSLSGVGKTNDLVESTTFCSGRDKEYIAGLSDGSQVTMECNFRADSSAEQATQAAMCDDVDVGAIRAFEIQADGDGDDVAEVTVNFEAICLSWVLNPSPSAKNSITFTFKITGGVFRQYA